MRFKYRCKHCGVTSEGEGVFPDKCPSCSEAVARRMEYGKLGRGPVLKGRTRFVSPGVAKALAQNKAYYNSRIDDIRSGRLTLDIPAGAPDAPDFEKKLY